METTVDSKIHKLKIGNTDVFLEDFETGRGKITISDTYGHNYSMFWGAMGSTIKEFVCRIDEDYFAQKLIPATDKRIIDIKSTFKEVREFIRTELDMPFYREMEFQKDMREKLKDFQNECEEMGKRWFVDSFNTSFVNSLDFYLISDRWEKEEIESNFKGISEPWHFLIEKPSNNYKWLVSFHKKLVKKLKK